MRIISNNVLLSKEGKVVEVKEIDNIIWKKVYFINTNNIDKIVIELGSVGKFTLGNRYFSDLQVEEHIPKLNNFNNRKHLKVFFKLGNKTLQKKNTFDDILGNYRLNFNKSIFQNSYGVSLNKIGGYIDNAQEIINKISTIFFVYTPEENQNGSIIYIPAANGYNSGINLDIQSNMGSDNRISITIVDKNYIYDIGLINNPIIFGLVLQDKEHYLTINGKKVKPIITSYTIEKQQGTCPDGWLYLGNNMCKKMNVNKGKCNDDQTINLNNLDKSDGQRIVMLFGKIAKLL